MRSGFCAGTRSPNALIVFGEADPPSHVGWSSPVNRSSPVSNRQAVQSPSGASAEISVQHFPQTLLAVVIINAVWKRSLERDWLLRFFQDFIKTRIAT